MKRSGILVAVSALLVLSLLLGGFGCGDDETTTPTPTATKTQTATPTATAPPLEPVKLALVTWLSGPVKTMGESSIRSIDLVVKEINDAGGILGGRKVELMTYEQGFTAEDVALAMKKAIGDGADIIHGGPEPGLQQVVLQLAQEAGLPVITFAAGDEELVKLGYKGAIHGSPTQYAWHNPGYEWIEEQGYETAAVIYLDASYSRTGSDILHELWDRPGSTVEIVDEIWAPASQVDLSVETARAVASDPDIIVCLLWGEAIVSLEKTAHELGYEGAIWIGGSQVTPDNIVPAGEASEGVFDFQWFFPDLSVPANRAYVEAYGEMWPGMVPLSEGTYEYIDLNVMLRAIDKAGTLTDLDKIYDAMLTLDWVTPHGTPVEVLPDGQVYIDSHYIVTVENGELVIIDEVDVSESLYRWWEREPERIWWE